MPLLLGLLVVEALVLRGMARSPFTPWLLLAWPMAAWAVGWTLYSVWDRFAAPKSRKPERIR
jgi:hypothetical protein